MNRRDFLQWVSALYGVAFVPLTPTGERDFVEEAQAAREAAFPPRIVTMPVSLLDKDGNVVLTRDVDFKATDENGITKLTTFDFGPTWENVASGKTITSIVADVPVGQTTKRLVFPCHGLPVYTNGGNITVSGLKVILA